MTRYSNATIVFVPGLRDHVDDHWQTHMAAEIAGSVTVEPLTEGRLSRSARVARLDETLAAIEGEVILVAHSAGVLMVAAWAENASRAIRGALLVTPADVERPLPPGYPTFADLAAGGWVPIPLAPLPFPSTMVASRNDPLAVFGRVRSLAACWGSTLHDAGDVGHLNPAAGYGHWPEGRALLRDLELMTAEVSRPK
jgi:predicted alpha/beta hydrolase family esterase